jgi:hypothetical protein
MEITIIVTGEPLAGVVPELGLFGKSREPLFDGRRALSRGGHLLATLRSWIFFTCDDDSRI